MSSNSLNVSNPGHDGAEQTVHSGSSTAGAVMFTDSLHSSDLLASAPHGPRSRANTWPVNIVERCADDQDVDRLPPLPEESNSGSSNENLSGSGLALAVPSGGAAALALAKNKKNSARRNPWGNMSYADLIEKAIDSVQDKRLTLSQIYDWLVQNVPYFKEKADSNSSAGWKNSVRHNLSLHNRFMRVQNETGTGKSSWWMVNQSAKFDKPSRRRAATLETKEYEKRKGRLKKQHIMRDRELVGGEYDRNISPISPAVAPHSPLYQHLAVSDFRSRASSNASSYICLSPKSPGGNGVDPDRCSSPAQSPHAWSTSGYDSTGSINGRLGTEFGFSYESDFANQLAKNVNLTENRPALAHSSFDHGSKLQQAAAAGFCAAGNASTTANTSGAPIGNYHPMAGISNGFLTSYTGHQTDPRNAAFYGQKFASIPEEPRLGVMPQNGLYDGRKANTTSSLVLGAGSVSGGGYTAFSQPQASWAPALPHDLESFPDPMHTFDFDWEELLRHEVAMDHLHFNVHGHTGTTHAHNGHSHHNMIATGTQSNGLGHGKPYVNGEMK